MIADSTSASSGETTSSRSASVLDGAICSSGTSSPVAGSRYCTRLWWVSSSSSSTLTPVARSTSMIAQVQKAWSSSQVRSRRLPVSGPRPRSGCPALRAAGRVKACPPAVNVPPGGVRRAAASTAAVRAWCPAAERTRTGSTGSRSRVRASIRDLRRRSSLRVLISALLTGLGAAHGPHRAGSSIAQQARSR